LIYSAEAERQIDDLRRHYLARDRIEAVRNLIAALAQAETRIEANPAAGLPAPRPYPSVARPDRAWVKVGRYWVAYSTTKPTKIVAVFHDTANIPARTI
jgi:plasmid stabilization system protein ParE